MARKKILRQVIFIITNIVFTILSISHANYYYKIEKMTKHFVETTDIPYNAGPVSMDTIIKLVGESAKIADYIVNKLCVIAEYTLTSILIFIIMRLIFLRKKDVVDESERKMTIKFFVSCVAITLIAFLIVSRFKDAVFLISFCFAWAIPELLIYILKLNRKARKESKLVNMA